MCIILGMCYIFHRKYTFMLFTFKTIREYVITAHKLVNKHVTLTCYKFNCTQTTNEFIWWKKYAWIEVCKLRFIKSNTCQNHFWGLIGASLLNIRSALDLLQVWQIHQMVPFISTSKLKKAVAAVLVIWEWDRPLHISLIAQVPTRTWHFLMISV